MSREDPVVAGIDLDTARHEVTFGGVPVELTAKEFALLRWFVLHPDDVHSAERLLEHVWDEHADPFTNTVRVTISNLRRKLADAGDGLNSRCRALRQDIRAQRPACLSRFASQTVSATADNSPVRINTPHNPLLLRFLLRKQGFLSDRLHSSGGRAQSAWGWRSCCTSVGVSGVQALYAVLWLSLQVGPSVCDKNPDDDAPGTCGATLEPRRNLSSARDSKRYTCE